MLAPPLVIMESKVPVSRHRKCGIFMKELFLFSKISDIRGICAYAGDEGLLICAKSLGESEAFFSQGIPTPLFLVVDPRYGEWALESALMAEVIVSSNPLKAVCDKVTELGCERLLVQDSDITHAEFKEILKAMRGKLTVRSMGNRFKHMRAIKNETEIGKIFRAVEAAEKAFLKTLDWLREVLEKEITEIDISRKLQVELLNAGSERAAFPIIVASGRNSRLPHSMPTSRTIEERDILMVDWGAVVEGYSSDMTRTVFIGDAPDGWRKARDAVAEALNASISHIREGIPARELFDAAAGVLEGFGMREKMIHGLGHGVGLEVHESPTLAAGSRDVIRKGMVFTIEPGVYFEDFGVRIEEMITVGRDGPVLLSNIPRTPDIV